MSDSDMRWLGLMLLVLVGFAAGAFLISQAKQW